MKTLVIIFIIVLTTSLSRAQEKELVGTWNIIECAYTTSGGTAKIIEDKIKSGNTITDYIIMEGGKLKQVSNMSGSGTLDSYEGTWKRSGNKIVLALNINNQVLDIEWNYELNKNILVLWRSNPSGTITISNTFRRK
jgi:hypothetical protein